MRLVNPRPTTQTERIYALEEARRTDGERFDKIEKTLGEIRDLLVKARGAKALIDGLFKYSGQISLVGGSAYAVWKFFGH